MNDQLTSGDATSVTAGGTTFTFTAGNTNQVLTNTVGLERLMPPRTISRSHGFRETNRRLSFLLDSMLANEPLPLRLIAPEAMSALLSELLRAGKELRAEALPVEGFDPELDEELDEHRRHVERLREVLPSIHRQLLAERARLEAQRSRVRSAVEWARASRQTLSR